MPDSPAPVAAEDDLASCISQNIYISGTDANSGKSVIVLGIMAMLSGHAGNVGFFRPVVRADGRDRLISLICQRYPISLPYEALYGCDEEQARQLLAADQYEELLKLILGKYRDLQQHCDHVLCVGTDNRPGDLLYEFDFNADVARNLGCLLLPVLHAGDRGNDEILESLASLKHALHERGSPLLATVINSVPPDQVDDLRLALGHAAEFPVYAVPLEPSLAKPSMGNIAEALEAKVLCAQGDTLNREVYQYKVAAMLVPDFLGYVQDGDLIITPGDRADIILASLMVYHSRNFPQIAGLLLTGSQQPAPAVQALIAGLGDMPFAVLGVDGDTFSTVIRISQVRAHLDAGNEPKIAKALGVVERSIDVVDLRQRLCAPDNGKTTPLMFEYDLIQRAKADKRHIVLPEGDEERVLRAAEILVLRDVVDITLLGDEAAIRQKIQNLGLKLDGVAIVNPLTSAWRPQFAETYYQARKHKNLVYDTAYDLMADVSYFGTLMVHLGLADGMVSGACHSTQHTIRPAFEIIKTRPGVNIVSSVFFMCLADRVLVYGDCAVNPNPDARQLAEIAISAADTARLFNIVPRVAMLSYSTGDSGKGEAVDKVREAVAHARALRPDLKLEGPIQYDAAIDQDVARSKLPGSEVAGQATVFIFPDLNTGNNTYKAVQRSSGALAIGPILQGLNKPVNDLSRGCTVPDIVSTVIVTAIQAQETARP